MKKINYLLLSFIVIIVSSFTNFVSLPIGSDMPKSEHKMLDISGKEISMKEAAKENGVLVIFSSNTCPYVLKNQTRITNLIGFSSKHTVGMIILNSNEAYREEDDSFKEMKKYAKKSNITCSYVIDKSSEIADAFGANRTPECFLFDKNMKLVYHGAIDDNPSDEGSVTRHHLEEAISEMADGKEISIKESKSVGCSIKRVVKE